MREAICVRERTILYCEYQHEHSSVPSLPSNPTTNRCWAERLSVTCLSRLSRRKRCEKTTRSEYVRIEYHIFIQFSHSGERGPSNGINRKLPHPCANWGRKGEVKHVITYHGIMWPPRAELPASCAFRSAVELVAAGAENTMRKGKEASELMKSKF